MNGVIGEIRGFAGNFAPRTWALCNGQLLAISANTALFSILGTTYGGDGRTTFALPDLRGRGAISEGTGPGLTTRKLGARFGTEDVTITQNQMASHFHFAQYQQTSGSVVIPATTAASNSEEPGPSYIMGATDIGGNGYIYSTDADDVKLANGTMALAGSVQLGNKGGGQSHNNMMPFTVINYIICLQGIYPSRS